MIVNSEEKRQYFNWVSSLCFPNEFEQSEYSNLLSLLFDIKYEPTMEMDKNRYTDGIYLRYIWADDNGIHYDSVDNSFKNMDCSFLEMMIRLAMRMEEILADPKQEDRTNVWFYNMLISLGLNSQTNSNFDVEYILNVISRFNDREFEPNGRGGLFTINDLNKDMRKCEIWYQMMYYINENE